MIMSKAKMRRRRKLRLLYGGTAVLMVTVLSTAWLLYKRNGRSGETLYTVEETAGNREEKGEIKNQNQIVNTAKTVIAGTDVTGLTRKEAEEALARSYPWAIAVSYEGEEIPVDNLLLPEWNRILDQVGEDGKESYSIDYQAVKESAAKAAETFAARWNRPAVSSQVTAYNKETKSYEYSKEQYGQTLNKEELASGILKAVESGEYNAVITPKFTTAAPERTAKEAKEQYRVIGSFSTKTTSNKNRNRNIQLAVDAIDGRILKPGEEFSFNGATGNRTSEKGYQPAGAYRNGVLIEEPGGGVCQVSTTLYNAMVDSGFKAKERNAHSFAPSYIDPGLDAMVSFDGYAGPDLRFVNTEDTSVAIRAVFADNQLKISLVGLPILEDGVQVILRSEKVKDVTPPAPVYTENGTIAFGTEKIVDRGKSGSVWKTFRVVKKGDQIIEETPLHNTTYKGKSPVIERNTTNASVQETTKENLAESAAVSQPETTAANQSEPAETAGTTGETENAGPGVPTETHAAEQAETIIEVVPHPLS